MTSSRIFQTSCRFLGAHIGAVIGFSSLLGVEVGFKIGSIECYGVKDFEDAKWSLCANILLKEPTLKQRLMKHHFANQRLRATAYTKGYAIRLQGIMSSMAADMINLEIGLLGNEEELVEEKKKRPLELFSHVIACLGVSEMLIAGPEKDETKCYEMDKEKAQQVINCLDGIRMNLSFGLKPSSVQTSPNNELQMAERLENLATEADGKLPMQWINSRRQPFCGMSSGRKLSDEELQDFSKSAQATHVSKLLR